MDVDSAGRDGNKRVFNRLGAAATDKSQKVCYHWRAGRCNRYPCPFLHRELPPPNGDGTPAKRSQGFVDDRSFSGPPSIRRAPNHTQMSSTWGRSQGGSGGVRVPHKTQDRVCHYWMTGKCSYGDKCRYLHSWSFGDCFSLLTQLEGHQKVVTGIALPSGSDKLYSGSKDESVRVWDCQTGQCAGVVNLGGEIGCMISEGPWVFVGIPNGVKAWNTQTATDLSLDGPVGQVYALAVGNEMLFAGIQDSNILAWKFSAATNSFQPAASLQGHTLAVVSLVVGANRLYSGSMDHTIRVWDLDTLQCLQTLTDHTSVVMSVLCWDRFLLSCSLDKTIKVWVATESGGLEVTYTHNEEHLSENQQLYIERPFSEEIKSAISLMAVDKSPGLDGLTNLFYIKCWDTVKQDIMKVFQAFHNNASLQRSLNATFITLIPKIDGAVNVKDFSLISLLHSF